MASFVAQLVHMVYGLIERVTGYGARAEDDKDAQKRSSADAFRTDEVIEIRSRNIGETGGSIAQVNRVGM